MDTRIIDEELSEYGSFVINKSSDQLDSDTELDSLPEAKVTLEDIGSFEAPCIQGAGSEGLLRRAEAIRKEAIEELCSEEAGSFEAAVCQAPVEEENESESGLPRFARNDEHFLNHNILI